MRWKTAGASAVFSLCVMVSLICSEPALAQMETQTTKIVQNDSLIQGRFLGLSEAVETALQQHPILQAVGANLKAAQARTGQIRSLYYPQVYADVATTAGAREINPRFVTPADAMLRQI